MIGLHYGGHVPEQQTFLSLITGSFSTPAAENPTVAMIEAAYEHHHIDARYLNCDVAPDALGDAVRGARAMGWVGFNCSMPHKASVIKYLDGLGSSAALIGAVNCVVRRDNRTSFSSVSVTRKMRAVFRWKFASCESDRCIALLFSL